MTTVLLIDGSNYLFRAFHALPPLATSRGEPTGAIKGFNGMLKTVFDVIKPDYAACVFDAPGKNFRHAIFPEYKANRPPMPDELRVQIAPIFELIGLKGIPLLQISGVEADDVLATLARRAQASGMKAVIATGDKDLAQVVNDDITLINTMTRARYDREGVFEKYGVYPERIIDYLALMGDKVDNVPGINKCGPKTAAKWIAEYGSMDALLEHAGEVKGKIGEYLREGMGFLDVARKLVTINTDAPGVDVKPQDLVVGAPDAAGLEAFFVRWEMRAGGRRAASAKTAAATAAASAAQPGLFDAPAIPSDAAAAPAPAAADTRAKAGTAVDSHEELSTLANKLMEANGLLAPAVVVLSEHENAMTETPVGLAIALSALESYYVPIAHEAGGNASADDVRELLGPWFAGAGKKVFYNAKFDGHVLKNLGLTVAGDVDDVFHRPLHPYSKLLTASTPGADASVIRIYPKGSMPSPIDRPAGCVFANRCPLAHDRCLKEVPKLEPVPADAAAAREPLGRGRAVACFAPLEELIRLSKYDSLTTEAESPKCANCADANQHAALEAAQEA